MDKTAQQIIASVNELARTFYRMHGCIVSEDFKFYNSKHPIETRCWRMAAEAFEYIAHTEVQDALTEVLEAEGAPINHAVNPFLQAANGQTAERVRSSDRIPDQGGCMPAKKSGWYTPVERGCAELVAPSRSPGRYVVASRTRRCGNPVYRTNSRGRTFCKRHYDARKVLSEHGGLEDPNQLSTHG